VWDGSTAGLYIDGSVADSENFFGPLHDADSYYTRIGAYGSSYYGFDGRIDEVRISSVARDPEEFVLRGPAKPDAGTEFLFHFLGGSSTLQDSSGYGRNMSFSYYSSQEWISDDGFGVIAGSINDYADPVTETWQGGLNLGTVPPGIKTVYVQNQVFGEILYASVEYSLVIRVQHHLLDSTDGPNVSSPSSTGSVRWWTFPIHRRHRIEMARKRRAL
jgi:hypothetical protein